MQHSPFVNWLARVLLGVGLALVSAQVGLIFGGNWWEVGVACAVVALVGIGIAARAEWVERRRRFLRRHCRTLSLPTPWSVKLDKRMRGGWTAPIAVIRDDGMRFVVDIQPFRSVNWALAPRNRKGDMEPVLVDSRGRRLRPDPTPTLAAGALAASAAPVLWLPRALEAGTHRHPDSNLVVVAGNARDLKLALQSSRRVASNARANSTVSGLQESGLMV